MSREIALLEKLEKEISLKQLQIKSLLTITQAINDNVSAEGLFNMYKSFLSWEMGIEKMALFAYSEQGWECVSRINFENFDTEKTVREFLKYKRLHTIKDDDTSALENFDIVIPVYHKENAIAYALIGGIKDKEDIYNKIQFITTITNIIAVAIENKRLFKSQVEQEVYSKELELAKEVQNMLIPRSLPNGKDYAISKIYMPHLEVGGDYLDYIKFSESRFAFCIADISGKGVAAALLMANFQAILQSLIHQYRDLATIVFALNQSVFKITKSDKYITFFIGEVDTKKRTLKYVNAGHYPPILYNEKNGLQRLKAGCTVIGAFENLTDIEENEIPLDGETTILCFTDGLADLQNEQEDYFEETRLDSFISNNHHLNPDELNDALLKTIDQYRGSEETNDDIAVLTCKIY
ncbi:MAG TPA: PP2C family protein-serine/threonine phosphatase [Saprospiraceae bacterium]|nr:PP2C family protein-serine/threonine phosphatase [Saprospiraceae bacterium]MCB9328847.1 PP2C family protein-serine/threonine phosphatase [Lewinellaceae bacterium]HPK08895.1 PP2C family protein-serine/threonine phosphatase [Saprospiraceae bacterium]HRX28463.1 PP2C family protein-serine/threonine phosphatase [Saprospiraceae bacterium]